MAKTISRLKEQPAFLLAVALLCAFFAGPAVTHAQNLPDAPPPPPQGPEPATPASHLAVPGTRPADVEALNRRQWSGVVEPGEKIPPLTEREKALFAAHEELNPVYTLVPIIFTGGYGVLRDSDPKLGTNGKAFGERVGETALRQVITRELSDSLLPIAFHQDPRYYRQAYGSYGSRTEHVIRRIFVTQSDSGKSMFNYSDVLGRGISAGLTQTYYPAESVRPAVALRTWGISLVSLGGGNFFEEFWPDVKRKIFGKSQ